MTRAVGPLMIVPMTPRTSSHPSRARRLGLAVAVGTALLIAACGGDGAEDGSGSDTTASAFPGAEADAGTETSGETGEEGDAGQEVASEDVCAAITAEDVQTVLTGADPITATPNEVIPSSCDYTITLSGGGSEIPAAVVQVQLAGDAAFYDAQRELQTDAQDLAELDEGFAFDDGGTILLTTDAGTWTVIRGVEITDGGTEAATAEQMVQIAELVQERL